MLYGLTNAVRCETETRHNYAKGREKQCAVAGNMIAHLENEKESSKKLLELMSKLKKMAKPKINFQNSTF